MSQRQLWVFVEQERGEIAPVGLELLGKAQELAQELEGEVVALFFGHNIADQAQRVIHFGADKVLLCDHPDLKGYRTLPYAQVASDLVQEHQPYILLLGATPIGRDLAPRIASAVGAGLTADCTALRIGDYEHRGKVYKDLLYQIRPAFGGNIIATIVNPELHPQMATVREGVMKLTEADTSRQGIVQQIEPSLNGHHLRLQILERQIRLPDIDLKNSAVIVAGGMGVGSREGFDLIRQLADVLGGEVAGSRAAVDAGFISGEHQVGQTGVTVRPRLYIACGISGAVQHRAGMDQSSKIIAINTDPNAPVFGVAHYKIVGDLRQVIPQLIKAYSQGNK